MKQKAIKYVWETRTLNIMIKIGFSFMICIYGCCDVQTMIWIRTSTKWASIFSIDTLLSLQFTRCYMGFTTFIWNEYSHELSRLISNGKIFSFFFIFYRCSIKFMCSMYFNPSFRFELAYNFKELLFGFIKFDREFKRKKWNWSELKWNRSLTNYHLERYLS